MLMLGPPSLMLLRLSTISWLSREDTTSAQSWCWPISEPVRFARRNILFYDKHAIDLYQSI
jgi:hypothetical protein